MKYVFLILFLVPFSLLAQTSLDPVDSIAADDDYSDQIFTVVDVMPSFPGGDEAMMKFIFSNVKYPDAARRYGHEGTVFVGFIIDKEGKIRDVKTVKGVSAEIDAESERVIGSMPRWIPGMHDGENVNVRFVLPIKFKLAPAKTKRKPLWN